MLDPLQATLSAFEFACHICIDSFLLLAYFVSNFVNVLSSFLIAVINPIMPPGRVPTEASGNVTEQTMAAIAATNVDFVSVGAITYACPSRPLRAALSGTRQYHSITECLQNVCFLSTQSAATRSLRSTFP